jgi:hypothetical protein
VSRFVLVGAVALICASASTIAADIEGTTFSSKTANVRMTLPRGWRWSDQATYPGILLRMNRTRPKATMLLAVDPLPTEFDPTCLTRPPVTEGAPETALPPELRVACQQSKRLVELGFIVGEVKEAARPWFDYVGKNDRQLRQGIAVLGEHVFTLVLSADTAGARAQYARTFDKALRSLRVLLTPGGATIEGDDTEEVPVEEEVSPDAGVAE